MFKPHAITLVFLAVLLPSQSNAGFLSEAWGVVTDPLKLDSSTENMIHAVERAALHMKDLKKGLDDSGRVVDANIRDYLTEIDDTINGAIGSADHVVSNALIKISSIEKDFFNHSNQLVKCSVELTSTEIINTLTEMLNTVGATKPRFLLFGFIKIGEVELTAQDISSPIEGYYLAQDKAKERLASLQETDLARKVEAIYGDMEQLAHDTKCHYESKNYLQVRLTKDIYEYRRLHRVWAGLVI